MNANSLQSVRSNLRDSTVKPIRDFLASVILLVCLVAPANAGLIQPFQTFFNTDWTSAGISGLRGQGTGNINLSGVSGSVSSAYLYWHGPTNSADPLANANITFAGNPVVGTNIGIAADNNWGFLNSQAYRANVTGLVSGNGNYALSGLVTLPNVEVNGASLLVFYDDANTANNRDVVVFNGNDSTLASANDPAGWQASLNGINYSGGPASIAFGVSDGQDFPDLSVDINGMTLVAVGDNPWQGTSLPDAGGGVGNGKLWDLTSNDLTPFLSLGVNNLSLTSATFSSDALSLIHLAIDLPAGAAPPTNNSVPEPGSLAVWSVIGCIGFGCYRRRRRDTANV